MTRGAWNQTNDPIILWTVTLPPDPQPLSSQANSDYYTALVFVGGLI